MNSKLEGERNWDRAGQVRAEPFNPDDRRKSEQREINLSQQLAPPASAGNIANTQTQIKNIHKYTARRIWINLFLLFSSSEDLVLNSYRSLLNLVGVYLSSDFWTVSQFDLDGADASCNVI